MEDAYFNSFSLEEQQAHHALMHRAGAHGAAASVRVDEHRNVAEVAVSTGDRRGLFADLAACLAAMGANVVGARVYTSGAGQALDIFQIHDAAGGAFGVGNALVLSRLTLALEAAARGETPNIEPRRLTDQARTAAFAVPAAVAVDNEASETATVVEVSGPDRPGLLEDLARALARAQLQVLSAHVDGYGERAVDAFYVCGEGGGKLLEPRRISALKAALTAALQAGETTPRRRLERARASAAR
jgi:[protein-PII] uridylyltransferase